MPGFDYGSGVGDGTRWSSERGKEPDPGGGSRGTGGGASGNNNSNSQSTPADRQLAAIRNDIKIHQKLMGMIAAARKINPAAKLSISQITPEGTLTVSAEGINADQAKQIGLGGLILGFRTPGYVGAVGDIQTKHSLKVNNPNENNYANEINLGADKLLTDTPPDFLKQYKGWHSPQEKVYKHYGNKKPVYTGGILNYSRVKNIDRYHIQFPYTEGKYNHIIEVMDGNLADMKVTTIGKKHPSYPAGEAKVLVNHFAPIMSEAETEVLVKASEIFVSAGDNISAYLGQRYNSLAGEIAGNIRNFRGKTIRSYDDAMMSLNKILTNPNLKINAKDRDAIINAWESLNAKDLGNKFAALSKTFKIADYAIKANNVRTKSIEGYQTGNWGPLLREVESWVASGIAASVTLAVFSVTLGTMLLWAGVPATAVGILGIMLSALVGALIDDKFIERLNNEIIRPAH